MAFGTRNHNVDYVKDIWNVMENTIMQVSVFVVSKVNISYPQFTSI